MDGENADAGLLRTKNMNSEKELRGREEVKSVPARLLPWGQEVPGGEERRKRRVTKRRQPPLAEAKVPGAAQELRWVCCPADGMLESGALFTF